jgi:hypothetical protein
MGGKKVIVIHVEFFDEWYCFFQDESEGRLFTAKF